MAENLLEMSKWTEDLCLRKYSGPRGLSVPVPGLYIYVYDHNTETSSSLKSLKLVSHWHANSSRLLREFSRGTFARHSCECRENFHVSRTSRELVAKVLNMFKNWMRIFFPKYFARLSRDCRATVVRRSCDGRATFVRMSRTCRREILANLQCEIFATLLRMSCECRTTVARQS